MIVSRCQYSKTLSGISDQCPVQLNNTYSGVCIVARKQPNVNHIKSLAVFTGHVLSIIVILYKEVDRFTETYEAYTKLRDFKMQIRAQYGNLFLIMKGLYDVFMGG
jgi:hypothetical protein